MSNPEDVSFTLQLTVDEAVTELRRLQSAAFQTIALLRKMGLPEDFDEAAQKIQMIISLLNQARLAAIALNAASGPTGWVLAGVGLAATGIQAIETIEYATRGR